MPVRTLAVLRPEPGNAATVSRAAAAGFATLSLPLFAVEAVDWPVPPVAEHDAIILTSANALRFGGAGLADLRSLPVFAVGAHTADAARAAGFDVMATGSSDGAGIATLASAHGVSRALHLTGVDRALETGGAITATVAVYRNAAIPVAPDALRALVGCIVLLHSTRAARRIDTLVADAGIDRSATAIAAFSPAIAAAAGSGWAGLASAATPDDLALFAAVAGLPETCPETRGPETRGD